GELRPVRVLDHEISVLPSADLLERLDVCAERLELERLEEVLPVPQLGMQLLPLDDLLVDLGVVVDALVRQLAAVGLDARLPLRAEQVRRTLADAARAVGARELQVLQESGDLDVLRTHRELAAEQVDLAGSDRCARRALDAAAVEAEVDLLR